MTTYEKTIAFGPVPSRRLGQSIGINNIPPKICTYSCIYCQLGRTTLLQSTRQPFYTPQEIFESVKQKTRGLIKKKGEADYLTFVANGEPTLDKNLGEEIEMLTPLGIKIAVITNASLICKPDVRDDLHKADWVSFKIDAVSQKIWRRINRPCRSLKLNDILKGMLDFSDSFPGDLVTETMLVQDVNDTTEEIGKIADFLRVLAPKKSYLSLPIRPPAEPYVKPADKQTLNESFQKFTRQGIETEYLMDYEGNAFTSTGNLEEDILGIVAVHPIREENLRVLLEHTKEPWDVIERLLAQQKIIRIEYHGKKFYKRKNLATHLNRHPK